MIMIMIMIMILYSTNEKQINKDKIKQKAREMLIDCSRLLVQLQKIQT